MADVWKNVIFIIKPLKCLFNIIYNKKIQYIWFYMFYIYSVEFGVSTWWLLRPIIQVRLSPQVSFYVEQKVVFSDFRLPTVFLYLFYRLSEVYQCTTPVISMVIQFNHFVYLFMDLFDFPNYNILNQRKQFFFHMNTFCIHFYSKLFVVVCSIRLYHKPVGLKTKRETDKIPEK